MDMNKEFYAKLKKISVEVEKEGYFLEWAYDSVYLSKSSNIDFLINAKRVSLYMHYKYDKSNNNMNLSFSADICTMAGGNKYYSVEECREVLKYWNHMLDLCDKLNNLNIIATPLEYKLALELINKRKQK